MNDRQYALGFGCASLYGLPLKRDRRTVLEAAYNLGIRHFDVAPMYGLGIAEAELGEFIGARSDVIVATKFGIRPTTAGRAAGLVQPPVRRLMQSFPAVKSKAKSSGSKRDAGTIGRLLYSEHDYSVSNARRALTSSLRALRNPRLNYFFLHEPAGWLSGRYSDLIDYLNGEVRRGTIESWGPAGDLSQVDDNLSDLTSRASAVQIPYDLIGGHGGPRTEPDRPTIIFGFISGALPRVRAALDDLQFQQQCSEMLDADLGDQRTVIHLLMRNAVTHNKSGTVLLSSTSTDHLKMACAAAGAPLRNEAEVARLIRQKCLDLRV